VRNSDLTDFNSGGFESLNLDRGAFVTLNKDGRLRGCIGYTAPMQPLCQTVRNAAASAAVKDHRFLPVSIEELDELTYDISVLSPFRLVTNIEQIEIGKHGLLIKNGQSEGLLLPQVASDNNWDRLTFLQQTCRKAGLPLNAWKRKDTDIFMFSAFVFSEEEHNK
jgi:AmmeMemoRadiSam system protein A